MKSHWDSFRIVVGKKTKECTPNGLQKRYHRPEWNTIRMPGKSGSDAAHAGIAL